MPSVKGEIVLRKWMMDKDTLGCSGQGGLQDLGELESGDHPTFRAFIWREKFKGLTLLFLTGFETILLELGAGDRCTLCLYVAITPNCHLHKNGRTS